MVLHLSRAMDVPPREQNILLSVAGFSPAFPETSLGDMRDAVQAIETMLTAHEPNMALAIDRRWNIVASNDAAVRFIAWAFVETPEWLTRRPNLARMLFHPDGLRGRMIDWKTASGPWLGRLERDVETYPSDQDLGDLVREIRSSPGVDSLDPVVGSASAGHPLVATSYLVDGAVISLFTTTTVIVNAHDLTLSELRIETFWPSDRASARRWEDRFGGGPDPN